LAALLGLLVLVGWYGHLPLLIRVAPQLAPMQYNTAFCFLVGGATTVAFHFRPHRVLLNVAAGVIAIMAVLTLAEYLAQRSLCIDELLFSGVHFQDVNHPGRMSPVSALCFLALAGDFVALTPERRSWRWATAGVLSLFVVSLGFIALFGYVFGLPGTYGWGQMTRVAVHTASGFILLGTGLFITTWFNSLRPEEKTPRWLPIAVAVATVTASLVLYGALDAKQSAQIAQSVHFAAENTKSQIVIRMEGRIRSLARMAARWALNGRPGHEDWEADATKYVGDFPDMEAIEWIDASHHLQWIAPLAGNEDKIGKNLLVEAKRLEAATRAETERQPVITPAVPLFHGGVGFIIYIPLSAHGHPDGVLAAVLRSKSLFDRYLPTSVAPGQAIRVSEGGVKLYERDADNPEGHPEWSAEEKVDLQGTTWTLHVWPSRSLLAQIDDPLPEIVLTAGLLGGLLLAAICYLTQRASRLGRIAAKARDALQRALDDVKTLTGLLPICACCKRVRDDTGYWSQVDTYLHQHTDAKLSHGYCPECAAKAFIDFGLEVPDRVKDELAAHRFE
jgi:sensor domain CHASE-containing protein